MELNDEILLEETEEESKIEESSIPLFGKCIKCKRLRNHYQWCQPCERKQCKENFTNWTSGNKEIDKFLRKSQLNSTRPQTFLEWIPFDRLENINILDTTSRTTIYSAIWKDGPRNLWDQQNEQYKRNSTIKVAIKLYKDSDKDQVKKILNELTIYLDCHNLLFQFYGISKQPDSNDYFIVKQYAQSGSLHDYISQNFNSLNWEIKLHLLLYLAEDLKALHNAEYVHKYLHPFSILVFDNNFCAIGTFSKCCKVPLLPLPITEKIIGWQYYIAPEYLRRKPYTKASDIYAFGMIMHTVGTGNIPYHQLYIDRYLTIDICLGLRPNISDNIPKSFKDLVKRCWNAEPDLRPNIREVYNTLLNLWSSIYHNKHSTSLNSICLEFLAADNAKPQESISKPKENIFELSDLINFIINYRWIKVINMNELSEIKIIGDHFGTLKATWKKKNNFVICKRLKTSIIDRPIETLIRELNIHKKLDFYSRIICIFGIGFAKQSSDEIAKDYLLVMQYADDGNLRKYLKQHITKLTWDDKIKLAYQITEGIKYLHGENIFHQDLHSKNIVIHRGEAKIIDLGIFGIAKSETGMIPYIDPKCLDDQSYKYDKKSDIYSLGVLMWELSSGHPPFINNEDENLLKIRLISGLREEPIPNTSNEYLELYQSCWDPEPYIRPSINQVFSRLEKMINIKNKKYLDPAELINLIVNKHYIFINIDELTEIIPIGDGHFGTISKATWKKPDNSVICKKLTSNQSVDKSIEAFLHKLNMHIRLELCPRIIHILGISFDENTNEYSLIMQYADGGNLREYLKHHFSELSSSDKIELAYQITEGIKYLHEKNILHQNLHFGNIVIHQGEAKITDFGIAKSAETETNLHLADIFGMISYIDPKLLENYLYKYDKKSDIYSLGVIMWELFSGKPPFSNKKSEVDLKMYLINGLREETNSDTPNKYSELYKLCWDPEPNIRPSINKVFIKLGKMLGIQGDGEGEEEDDDDDIISDQNKKRLESSELIDFIINSNIIKYIRKSELTKMIPIGDDYISTISKTNNFVVCKKFKNNLLINNKSIEVFLYELNMHRKLGHCSRILRIFGISFDENAKEYLLIMQYADGGNLHKYLKQNFSKLTWDNKIRFAYQITEGIKYLHEENIYHQNLHSKNIVIHQGEAKIIDLGILGIAKSTETEAEMIPYIDPKCLEGHSYDKKSDIYSLGVLMWELSSSYPPFKNKTDLKMHLINGLREEPSPNTPIEYLELYQSCWDPEPDTRPSINQVFSKLEKMMNIQNNKNLEPSKLIDFIIKERLIKFIDISELEKMIPIGCGHFGTISKAIWKKTNNLVACKKLRNNQSINKPIEAFLHELKMHGRLNFCPRIIRILGISFDERTREYLLIMQYADGGDLREYLKHHFSELTSVDKIKLAYQITEGIKYLHGENILHRDLHSGNIVIHQGVAKITDLGIAKSSETETNIHSGVHGITSYIDPKLLEDFSYKYNKKSDIYSLGVLMWELFSGRPPFINSESEKVLKIHLVDGLREEPYPDTPNEYLKLYKLCWDPEPNVRPTIDKVFIKLGKMLNIQVDDDDDDIKDSKNEQANGDNSSKPTTIMKDGDDLVVPDDL